MIQVRSCRSCSAGIVWMQTKTGKTIPVDVASVRNDDTLFDPAIHKSHFITCPDADKHRKSR